MIDLKNVKSSYNGKSGCMCGCLGKYSVQTDADRLAHNKAAGWDAIDSDGINPRAVKLAVSKLNKILAMSEDTRRDNGVTYFVINDNHASVDIRGRNTTVYFQH